MRADELILLSQLGGGTVSRVTDVIYFDQWVRCRVGSCKKSSDHDRAISVSTMAGCSGKHHGVCAVPE